MLSVVWKSNLREVLHRPRHRGGCAGENEKEMTAMIPATTAGQDHVTVTPHTVERLTARLGLPYAEALTRFEQLVPAAPLEKFLAADSWDAVKALLDATPLGFMRYAKLDSFALFAPSGITRQSVEYLAGNHAIAETTFRREPGVVLYAPLRLLFHAGDDGKAVLSIDRPSDLFGSFGDPHVTKVGRLLDGKVAAILEGLGVTPPTTLTHMDAA
jgi:hypothetical protein